MRGSASLPLLNVHGKQKRSSSGTAGAFRIYLTRLADLRAQETAAIFYAYSAAAEQISDGGDGFAAALGARANGED
jgi:hypothetical protein